MRRGFRCEAGTGISSGCSALAALELDAPRAATRAAAIPVRTVRAIVHPVHPSRIDRDVAAEEGWTLVATQFDRIVVAPPETSS